MTQASFDTTMLLMRIGFGLMMAAHGVNHLRGGGKIAGTARWFESLGLKPGVLHAWMSVVTEIGAGVGLALGIVTPLVAGALISTMVVAIMTVHRYNGFFIIKEGWEYTGLIILSLIAIATLGAGSWSLDHAIHLDDKLGFTAAGFHGMLISLAVGIGGASGLLAAYWRPPVKTSLS